MIMFWIAYVLIFALFAAVLELNKNTLTGWGLLLVLAVLFAWFYRARVRYFPWYGKCIGWLALFVLFAGIMALSWPPVKPVPAVPEKNPEITEAVMTDKGAVRGVYTADHLVEVYAGIPYAKPPVGELRWRPPADADPWEGELVCDHFAPMSMQSVNVPVMGSLTQIVGYHDYKISLRDNYREPVSEDSLYLNIWKPAGEQKGLPVLVYIHGGSLQTGQPWYGDYSGVQYARDGVVAVNMGYRLGVFGFYADEQLLAENGTTGNYGLLDQIKALEWVRDNIAAFGGDPENVTIIGESAGAVCVDALCVSPLAKGLFRRAILESSTLASQAPPHSFRLFDEAVASGNTLRQKYGCASTEDLRALPAEKIVGEMNTQHHVTVDGYVLPDTPYQLRLQGQHNEEALLHGYNAKESGPFLIFSRANLKNYEEKVRGFFGSYADRVLALYPAANDEEADRNWAQIYGAVFFNYSHYCLNRLAADNDIPVWEYYFSRENGRLGSWHSGEMVYTFGVIPEDSKLYDTWDRELMRQMHSCWVSFAKYGDPSEKSGIDFPQNADSAHLMQFGDSVGVIDEPYLQLYEILDEMAAEKAAVLF